MISSDQLLESKSGADCRRFLFRAGSVLDDKHEQNGIIGNLQNDFRPLLATILISTLN